jgi:predicted nucleotidyltransferase
MDGRTRRSAVGAGSSGTSNPAAFARQAAQVLAADSRVEAVYCFGSVARGGARPTSDLDLAVLLQEAPTLGDELRLRARVTAALRRDDVDLVILNDAPPLLRFEAIAGGRRLFARDELAVDLFEHRSIMERLDTNHLRRLLQSLAREASVGGTGVRDRAVEPKGPGS